MRVIDRNLLSKQIYGPKSGCDEPRPAVIVAEAEPLTSVSLSPPHCILIVHAT